MLGKLAGRVVAILVADGFEQVELTAPRAALELEGATTEVVSPAEGTVQGWIHDRQGDAVIVDVPLAEAFAQDYDALVLPGGAANAGELRTLPEAVQFVKAFFDQHKPVAAICHGPWSLVEADVLNGRTLTSWPLLRADIRDAGGIWVDSDVVVDNGLVTSRKQADIPAFNGRMIEEFQEGRHDQNWPGQKSAADARAKRALLQSSFVNELAEEEEMIGPTEFTIPALRE
jgi:protease I